MDVVVGGVGRHGAWTYIGIRHPVCTLFSTPPCSTNHASSAASIWPDCPPVVPFPPLLLAAVAADCGAACGGCSSVMLPALTDCSYRI